MANVNFTQNGDSATFAVSAALIPGAPVASIVTIPCWDADWLTVSCAVTGASLNAFEVWARGDPNAAWVPIAKVSADFTAASGLYVSIRSDNQSDLTTTPAGVTAVFVIEASYWASVQIRTASAGAAIVTISAGDK